MLCSPSASLPHAFRSPGRQSSTSDTTPDAPEVAAMPSQGPYYRDPYHHSRTGSGGSSSVSYPHSRYPSPTDSGSSRGRRTLDVEMADAHDGHRYSSQPRGRNAPAYMPNGLQTESRDDPPQFSVTQSSRNPSLHFLLAQDSARTNRFVLDMRRNPHDIVTRSVYENYGGLWVTRDRPLHVRIVSRDFPWVIDIKAGEAPEGGERGVTCGDVWSRLYQELLEPIHDTDWAYLSDMAAAHDSNAQRRLEYLISLARQQIGRGEDVALVRLNWLMRKTVFVGLERDEGYRLSAQRLLPGRERCEETWVAQFSERD